MDFNSASLSQYDKPHNTDDDDVRTRIAKWAMANSGTEHMVIFDYLRTLGITKFTAGTTINNIPSVALLKSLGFELVGTENVSFYKDAQGNDIVFEGGIFELNTVQ